MTGLVVQRNKAIVGQNAFAHEAGIHQHGVIQNRLTYEIMKPEDIGLGDNALVLGKHSGRHALRKRLHELGHELGEEELDRVFIEFKALADTKKEVLDDDLETLMKGAVPRHHDHWELVDLHVSSGTSSASTATIGLRHSSGRTVQEAACGGGPVEAIFRAMGRATGTDVELVDFQIRGLTAGLGGEGEVTVEVEEHGRRHRGRATGSDITQASAEAFIRVINRVLAVREANKELVDVFGQ